MCPALAPTRPGAPASSRKLGRRVSSGVLQVLFVLQVFQVLFRPKDLKDLNDPKDLKDGAPPRGGGRAKMDWRLRLSGSAADTPCIGG